LSLTSLFPSFRQAHFGFAVLVTAVHDEGEVARILEGPVEADGFTWWKIEGESGTGWSAQQSKEGVVWLQPINGP